MKLIERLERAIELGYTYDKETGFVYNRFGKKLIHQVKGYPYFIITDSNKKRYGILQHKLGWYFVYKEVVDCIDHINGNTLKIVLNGKSIYLGCYETEDEARQTYLDAKKIYHQI